MDPRNIADTPPATPRTRPPAGALGALTVAALLGIAALYAVYMIALQAAPNWSLLTIAIVPVLCAVAVASGRAWAPILGPVMGVAVLASPVRGDIPYNLARPGEPAHFAYSIVLLAVIGVGTAAGLGATLFNLRGGAHEERGPRPSAVAMTTLNGLVLGGLVGALLIAASPQPDEGVGLSDEQLAALPGFTMVGLRFEPARIEARVGETVAVRYTNRDGVRHAFDLDSFDVHVPVPSGRTGVVIFTPTRPGTYVFYCGVGDHRAAGMVGTLVVAP